MKPRRRQNQNTAFTITHKTIAPYAQGTYHLNDSGIAVTLGARYTDERVGFNQDLGDSNRAALGETPPVGISYDRNTPYHNVSWHLGLEDQLDSNWLLYAVSRRANKSSGYNGTIPPVVGFGDTGGNAFRQERVTDVEIGTKFLGSFSGLPVRMDVAVFNVWDDNAPHRDFALVGANPSSLTVNVPYTNIYGVELDAQIKPIAYVTTGVTFAYTHAQFGTNRVYDVGSLPTGVIYQINTAIPGEPRTLTVEAR